MKKGLRVNYEWVLEILYIDNNGMVLDREPIQSDKVCLPDNLGEVYSDKDDTEQLLKDELVLVRDVWDTEEGVGGLEDRSWAYVESKEKGKWILPKEFDDGIKVPKRFHDELKKVQED